jgi:hypothetical protein
LRLLFLLELVFWVMILMKLGLMDKKKEIKLPWEEVKNKLKI